jgi:NCS1 family nucleobase:cation symporter-1
VGLAVSAGGVAWSFGARGLSGGTQLSTMLWVVCLSFSSYTTLLLNLCDFSRFSPHARSVTWGNFWGLPVNGGVFAAVVAVSTIAGTTLYGPVFTEPTDLLAASHNRILIIVGAALFLFATMGVNIIANAVSPGYDFANLFPRHITFSRGIVIASILSLVCLPWKMYSSPLAITYFLGSVGALLGPVFGVMMVDYYLLRRGILVIDDLYSDRPTGPYFYRRGVNPRAFLAFAAGAAVSVPMAVLPPLHAVAPYAWFAGVAFAGAIYGLVSLRLRVTGRAPVRQPVIAAEQRGGV